LLQRAPSSAAKCHSMKELRAWRRAQRAMIDAYVPEAYESFPGGVLKQQFSDNEKRIKQEEAAAEAQKSQAEDKAPKEGSAAPQEGTAATQAAPVLFAGESAEAAGETREAKAGGAWQDMVKTFAGDQIPRVKNMSDHEAWTRAFVEKYASASMHYVQAQQEVQELLQRAPSSAAKCHSMKELRAWYHAQEAAVHAYVPRAYAAFSSGALEQEYEANAHRIRAAQAEAEEGKAEAAKEATRDDAATKDAPPAGSAASLAGAEVPVAGSVVFALLGAVAAASVLLAVAVSRRAAACRRPLGAFSEQLLAAEPTQVV